MTAPRAAWLLLVLIVSLGATSGAGSVARGDPASGDRDPRVGESADERAAESRLGELGQVDWLVRYLMGRDARDRVHASRAAGRLETPSNVAGIAATPPNTLVNSKMGDAFGSAQVEPSVAMLGPFGVCAFNTDKLPLGGDGMSASYTTADGSMWTPAPLPPFPGMPTAKWVADPVVVANEKSGDFTFSGIFTPSGSPSATDWIAIVHGTFGGPGPTLTWAPPVIVREGMISAIIFDKEWLAADSSSGNLYLTYTAFGTGTDSILFQRSTDGGATWSTPLTMIAATPALLQGSRVAVGPAGEVYVAWFHAAGPPDSMQIRTSTDHGLTFGPVVTAATVFSDYGSGAPGSNLKYAPNYPSLAVDRSFGDHRGRVYMEWAEASDYADDALGTGGDKSEVAPSGGIAHATSFTPGMVLRGTLTSGDVDTWSFSSMATHTYIFYVDSIPAGFSADLYVSCGDTTEIQFYGHVPPAIGSGKPPLYVFSPSEGPGPWFLKLVHTSSGVAGYRIKTGMDDYPPAFGHGFDQRDVMVSHSDDGTTWSPRVRVNHDAPGADQVMPEVAVTTEGYVYASWFDEAAMPPPPPGTCSTTANVSSARSTDGGATWSTELGTVTSVATDWAHVPSDIVPNQGDYISLSGGFNVGYAFADGRLGDPDIFFSEVHTGLVFGCAADSAWNWGSTRNLRYGVANPNPLFTGTWNWTLTSQRDWPGFPATGSVTLPPGGPATLVIPASVPDTAATGVNLLTLHLVQPNGARAESCVVADTVSGSVDAVLPPATGAHLALARVWPNPTRDELHVSFALASAAPADLELFDIAGRRLLSRPVGSLGPGPHTLDLGRETRALPIGVYALRLSQSGRAFTRRVAVLR